MAFFRIVIVFIVLILAGCDKAHKPSDSIQVESLITVYSERKEHLLKPLFELYTRNTGIKIRYITDSAGPLIARLQSEGEATPADILITVDAGNLWQAAERNLLQEINSDILLNNVPEHLRSTDRQWFGLSLRARTIVYATDRVQPEMLSTYENLADPMWRGRLCLRTSKKVYNQSLVATMIKTQGEMATENIVKGWVANLATVPYSNDTKVMEAILAGQCDISIVNTYYYGRLKKTNPNLPLALFWPNQQDRGVHVNISGAGVTRHAKSPQLAQGLLEWLSSTEAQYQFAQLNQEYPIHPQVQPSPEVASWGSFKADTVNLEAAGRLQAAAIKLMDRAAYR